MLEFTFSLTEIITDLELYAVNILESLDTSESLIYFPGLLMDQQCSLMYMDVTTIIISYSVTSLCRAHEGTTRYCR